MKDRLNKPSPNPDNFRFFHHSHELELKFIAQELQNCINQILYSAKLKISLIEKNDGGNKNVSKAKSLIDEAMQKIRDLSYDLYPLILSDLGLLEAIKNLTKEFKYKSNLDVIIESFDIPAKLPLNLEITTYRIIKELLNKAHKHNTGSRIGMNIYYKENTLNIKIRDNNKCFNFTPVKPSKPRQQNSGLYNLEERLELVYGKMEIKQIPVKGNEITIKLPDLIGT